MILKKIPDTKYYFNVHTNSEGNIHLCMQMTVMGSIRVVVHPNDDYNVWASFCCGKNFNAVSEVWLIVYEYLTKTDDNLDEIGKRIRYNSFIEMQGSRPWGKNPEFQEVLRNLVKKIISDE